MDIVPNYNGSELPKYAEIIELLLVHGADVDLQDCNGDTALHCLCSGTAIKIGLQIPMAEILMEIMKDIDTVNFAGRTALGVLVENEDGDRLVCELIQSGARLLRRSQGVEIGLDIERSPNERLSFVTCHLRRGLNTFTKRFGYLLEDPNEGSYRLRRFPLVDLRRLLRNLESFDLEDGSWVRYAGTTLISPSVREPRSHERRERRSSPKCLPFVTSEEVGEPRLSQSLMTL